MPDCIKIDNVEELDNKQYLDLNRNELEFVDVVEDLTKLHFCFLIILILVPGFWQTWFNNGEEPNMRYFETDILVEILLVPLWPDYLYSWLMETMIIKRLSLHSTMVWGSSRDIILEGECKFRTDIWQATYSEKEGAINYWYVMSFMGDPYYDQNKVFTKLPGAHVFWNEYRHHCRVKDIANYLYWYYINSSEYKYGSSKLNLLENMKAFIFYIIF